MVFFPMRYLKGTKAVKGVFFLFIENAASTIVANRLTYWMHGSRQAQLQIYSFVPLYSQDMSSFLFIILFAFDKFMCTKCNTNKNVKYAI